MIQLQAVHKRFGPLHAVRGVSLEIPKGQVVGILGPNGAGKTTTIRMIAGSFPPSEGRVLVDGLDSVSQTMAVRQRLGYLPESAPLYRDMRVEDYLEYRASIFRVARRQRREAIGRAVDRCQLGGVLRQRVGTLSKGFRQRVGVASVLVHEPKVLILDEPTSGLDPAQISEFRGLIRDLAGERTTLLVSHILPEVERCCDRIVMFMNGLVQADGSPTELALGSPGAGEYVVEARREGEAGTGVEGAFSGLELSRPMTLGALEAGWWRVTLPMQRPEEDHRERIARCASAGGLLVRELRPPHSSLEEVYLRLLRSSGVEGPVVRGGGS